MWMVSIINISAIYVRSDKVVLVNTTFPGKIDSYRTRFLIVVIHQYRVLYNDFRFFPNVQVDDMTCRLCFRGSVYSGQRNACFRSEPLKEVQLCRISILL